ncbi:hypothetical protein [Flavobacterium psychrotrophum]|uniref:hypothetical protein n=1 Tax=Flavobacterium psychrotrophum TaxID=2294119 RepID=UPI000E31858F|nr:hypothetical protein [Flavobacterium psychrotrophum]
MKKFVTAAALLFMGIAPLMAQNKIDKINVSYGQELPDDKQKLVDITGEANGKIYGLAIKGKDTYMLKIFDSSTMGQLSSHEILIPDLNDREVEFENLYLLNGKLYVVGSVYNKKDKIFNLVATPLSEEGKLSKDGVVLFKSEVEKKSERGGFYFRKTQDENGLLVMHASRFKKEDVIKYDIKLFDDNLQAIFSTTEKVKFDDNHKDYEFYIPDFQAGLNDDVYVVINEGYRDNKKKERVERFEIHAYKGNNNYAKEVINIDVKDQAPINCKIVPSGDILHLMGFYSSVRESGRSNKELKGVYAATVNMKDNKVTSTKFNDLDHPTRVKLIGERRAKKGKDVPPLYNIIHIIGREDGGMIMVSEYQLVVIGQSAGIGPLAFTPVTYVKNEIIVTSLAPDGSHEWSNVLPKAQTASITTMSLGLSFSGTGNGFAVGGTIMIPLLQMGKGPEYLGALPIYKNGQLSILINDNVKNKGITDIEEIKSMGNYNNAVPSLFIFSKDGKIVRKDPEEVIKNELVIRPGVNYAKTNNEYIIYSSRKKSDKLGRMILED